MVWGRSREHHTILPASAYSFTFVSQSCPRPHGFGWHALSSVRCDGPLRIPSAGIPVPSRCLTTGRHLSSAEVRCALLGNTSSLFSPRRVPGTRIGRMLHLSAHPSFSVTTLLASPPRSRSTPRQVCVGSAFTSFRPYTVRDSSSLPTGPIQGFPPPDRPRLLRLSSSSEQLLIVAPACARDASSPHHCVSQPFFEGNGPARQGLCGLDFWPCLSSELSSPSVPLAAARARHTRQRLSCGPEATAAL